MKAFKLFKKKISWLFRANLIKTMYFNFRVFPLKVACLFPICIGWRTKIIGVRRGCISFRKDVTIKPFMVQLGMAKSKMFADYGLYTLVRLSKKSRIEFGGGLTRFYSGCSIILIKKGILTIGDDFIANQCVLIYCSSMVKIGNFCNIGWHSQIYDTDFHLMYSKNTNTIRNPFGFVQIGNNVWITNRCTISKGAYIPDYSIVASNSLFNRDYSDVTTQGNLFAGSPAKLKKTGFFRIRNNSFQKRLFNFFYESGCKEFYYKGSFDDRLLSYSEELI